MKMASSIPATNNLSMAANNNTNDAQMNFNPSWMQSTAPPMQRSLSVSTNNNNSSKSGGAGGGSATSNLNAKKIVSENDETCDPIFAKHSYGREDLLAMMGRNTMKPPLDIKRCPFFVDSAQTPIILMPFTDIEMRLQQNMNSSKAMSTKKKTVPPFSRIVNEATTKKFGETEDHGPMHKNSNNTTGSNGSGSGGAAVAGTVTAAKEPPPAHALKKPPATAVAAAAVAPVSAVSKGTPTPPPPSSSSSAVTASAAASAPATTTQTAQFWCYLDPSGTQRGPFDTHQMQAWFSSGYFSDNLQVRRKEETTYTTLGDLFLINGRETPFKIRAVTPAAPVQKPLQQQKAATAFPSVQQRISPSDLIESITQHPHISPNLESVQSIWATTPLEEVAVGGAGGGASVGGTTGAAASSVAPPSNNSGGGSTTVAAVGDGGAAGSAPLMAVLQSKEMQILEEQRKLREKEELLRRDELERAEKERRMRDLEAELKRHQEELGRRAREKDAEFEQRYAQMAEYERKRRDELAALEQRIRNEHLQHQLRLEEEDRRRAKELEELLRREQERQHQLVEAEMKRKREEEELRLRLAFQEKQHQQELIREKARRAEEEQRRRLIEEQQRQQQMALEEARAERVKQQRVAAKAEAAAAKAVTTVQQRIDSHGLTTNNAAAPQSQWQQQMQQSMAAMNSATASNSFSFSQPAQQPRAAAWQTIPTPPVLPIGQHLQQQSPPVQQFVPPPPPPQQHNLQQQPPAVTEQRRGWQPVQLPKPAPIPPAIGKPQDGGGAAAPKAPAGNNKKQQKKQSQQKHKQPEKQVPLVEDKFTVWIIKRVKALNPSVDAEVFATFISDIDSPNEAEDYIIGYLGEKKEVKEFHRDFLQKRIELRPRAHPQAPKDDLSRPAAALSDQHHKGTGGWASSASGVPLSAPNIGGGAATTAAANSAAQNANNNKKKKGGQKGLKVVSSSSHQLSTNKFTVLDASTLGFRPASDPNRLNAGEIDSVPPVPGGGGGGGNNKKR
ncbi:hypothetical protein niasHT_022881 [Heterodera trifolii]|uniref:GYF domain-containing protein n=1 Tax=Heterodera trifolii TaxID=157864 RepID=A0ABD2KJF8_9BILA